MFKQEARPSFWDFRASRKKLVFYARRIEVKALNKNDLIGRVVISTAGRDKEKLYIVLDVISYNYVLVADGKLKTQDKPKKKKLRHLRFTDIIAQEIKSEIILGKVIENSTIRKFLQLNDIVKEV
ncbi:KOW domain-containing RNA-binding protein [Clostridium sp. 19966]|uniref:KOW domain-containing RNA-binding protein n=1 Tax=Clostridium sp. 19966 TaxID=2768166 RepID=UPI0028E3EEC9|nr:KOW domain-containing RNA-binding protein [Clostridium sp. 19966]